MALGISLSDTFYVIIVLFGMSKMLQTDDFKFWIAIFGSIMLCSYAVYSWFRKPRIMSEEAIAKDSSYLKYLIKGLFLNGLNPFIIVSWATWVSAITINFEYGFNQQIQFFAGMLIMIFSMDVGKAFVAHRLKHLITVKFIVRMNRTVAVILVLFTIQILYFLYQNYI